MGRTGVSGVAGVRIGVSGVEGGARIGVSGVEGGAEGIEDDLAEDEDRLTGGYCAGLR